MYTLSQAQIFMLFFILGLAIGVLFDFFRSLRKTFRTTNFVTYIEDIIFMAIVGILIINSLIILNNGQLRIFIIIAILLGVGIYFLLISRICFKLFYYIMIFFKKIIYLPKLVEKCRKK